jgi:hypothetical protein
MERSKFQSRTTAGCGGLILVVVPFDGALTASSDRHSMKCYLIEKSRPDVRGVEQRGIRRFPRNTSFVPRDAEMLALVEKPAPIRL